MSSMLPFAAFDADNHYYEAEDAFTRHVDPKMHKRCMQWAQIDGRQRLLVGGKVNRFIPNPTFDPVARPGCLDDYFRGKVAKSDMREAFGELVPIPDEYRDRESRLLREPAKRTERLVAPRSSSLKSSGTLRDVCGRSSGISAIGFSSLRALLGSARADEMAWSHRIEAFFDFVSWDGSSWMGLLADAPDRSAERAWKPSRRKASSSCEACFGFAYNR